jgi:hypothetical protein
MRHRLTEVLTRWAESVAMKGGHISRQRNTLKEGVPYGRKQKIK